MRVCWCVGTRDMSRVKLKVISWWELALFFHQVCLGRLNSTFTCQTILLAVFVDSRQSLLCSLWLALNLGSYLLTLLSAGFPGLCHHAQFVCLYVCGCVVCVCRGGGETQGLTYVGKCSTTEAHATPLAQVNAIGWQIQCLAIYLLPNYCYIYLISIAGNYLWKALLWRKVYGARNRDMQFCRRGRWDRRNDWKWPAALYVSGIHESLERRVSRRVTGKEFSFP